MSRRWLLVALTSGFKLTFGWSVTSRKRWNSAMALSASCSRTPEEPPLRSPVVVPRHLAIIPDGNGRWAEERGLPRAYGHVVGAERIKEVTLDLAFLNEATLDATLSKSIELRTLS